MSFEVFDLPELNFSDSEIKALSAGMGGTKATLVPDTWYEGTIIGASAGQWSKSKSLYVQWQLQVTSPKTSRKYALTIPKVTPEMAELAAAAGTKATPPDTVNMWYQFFKIVDPEQPRFFRKDPQNEGMFLANDGTTHTKVEAANQRELVNNYVIRKLLDCYTMVKDGGVPFNGTKIYFNVTEDGYTNVKWIRSAPPTNGATTSVED